MTDTQTPAPTSDATSPAPDPAPAPSSSSSSDKRYCAYDTTYLKFVGAVVDTKAKAKEQAKLHSVDDFEIREV